MQRLHDGICECWLDQPQNLETTDMIRAIEQDPDIYSRPSEFHFVLFLKSMTVIQKNTQPISRDERKTLKDKVVVERTRISQRTGYQARIQRENGFESSTALTTLKPGAAGYISDSDRFHTDVSGEELQGRITAIKHKCEIIDTRRTENIRREAERTTKIAQDVKETEDYWNSKREAGSMVRQLIIGLTITESEEYQRFSLRYHNARVPRIGSRQ